MQAGVLPWPTLRYLSLPSDCATGCGGRGCKRWNGPISKRLANWEPTIKIAEPIGFLPSCLQPLSFLFLSVCSWLQKYNGSSTLVLDKKWPFSSFTFSLTRSTLSLSLSEPRMWRSFSNKSRSSVPLWPSPAVYCSNVDRSNVLSTILAFKFLPSSAPYCYSSWRC